MQALKDSELLRVLQPAYWGGYERDLRTFLQVATEIARGDTSTGWVYCILGIHNFWISYVEPELQEELWGEDSSVLMADSFAPHRGGSRGLRRIPAQRPVELFKRSVV